MHYILYLLYRQSSCRGFDRAFSKAFGRAFSRAFSRAFAELYMEVRVELCRASVELRAELR